MEIKFPKTNFHALQRIKKRLQCFINDTTIKKRQKKIQIFIECNFKNLQFKKTNAF